LFLSLIKIFFFINKIKYFVPNRDRDVNPHNKTFYKKYRISEILQKNIRVSKIKKNVNPYKKILEFLKWKNL
jgi:hypothetical protein